MQYGATCEAMCGWVALESEAMLSNDRIRALLYRVCLPLHCSTRQGLVTRPPVAWRGPHALWERIVRSRRKRPWGPQKPRPHSFRTDRTLSLSPSQPKHTAGATVAFGPALPSFAKRLTAVGREQGQPIRLGSLLLRATVLVLSASLRRRAILAFFPGFCSSEDVVPLFCSV